MSLRRMWALPPASPSAGTRRMTSCQPGFALAYKLRYQHPEMQDIVENVIYVARNAVGGTWLVNTYPRVQCGVAAHLYVWYRGSLAASRSGQAPHSSSGHT
jgi:cation diffusion facilitator CzcD-associated flavoprotein CzcO